MFNVIGPVLFKISKNRRATERTQNSPAYMALEQVRGEPADQRSDLFAFGCILCEMIQGESPFRRNTTVERMNAILNTKPLAVPISTLPPFDLPEEIHGGFSWWPGFYDVAPEGQRFVMLKKSAVSSSSAASP